MPHRKNLG